MRPGGARSRTMAWTAFAAAVALVAAPALADGPRDWNLGFPEPGSPLQAEIIALHGHILLIGGGIVLLVVGLVLVALFRFRESRQPVPARFSRSPLLEFGWTVAPVLVLGAIVGPSIALLAAENRPPAPDITVKVTAHQWFWTFAYPDQGDIRFNSIMLPPESLGPDQPRLLTADNALVLPVGANVRFEVTGSDVVHSFFVPVLGLQIYAVPGRLNATWTRIDRPGRYYGQCNQICGLNHSFMPIAIEALAADDFAAWVAAAPARFGALSSPDTPRTRMAAAMP